jgi:hypothetical protein
MRTIEEIKSSIARIEEEAHQCSVTLNELIDTGEAWTTQKVVALKLIAFTTSSYQGYQELVEAQDAEIERLRQQLEWQPIETAPHNQWLFTYGDPSLKKPVPGKLFDADDERSAGWRTFGGAPINPTCYFPLPQPPLPQAQEGNHEND